MTGPDWIVPDTFGKPLAVPHNADYVGHLTWRQLRLLDFLENPEHPELPTDPAIKWRQAMWRIPDLVRLSGVATIYTYARCRHDLEALHAVGLVERLARTGPWYLSPNGRSEP